MTQTADLLHHVPGRLRLRIRDSRGNPAGLETIHTALAGLSGVRRIETNPTLGTMVIQYDSALFAEFPGALEEYASQYELFAMPCPDTEPCISDADRSISRAFSNLNRSIQEALGNAINLKELAPIAVAIYGFLFVDRNVAAAQWLNWLQFALDTYIDLHEGEPVAELGHKLEAMGARILERQSVTETALIKELAEIRAELREISKRLPASVA